MVNLYKYTPLLDSLDFYSSLLYTKNLKSAAVVRQKLYTALTRSVTLGWGRASPLRWTRWPGRHVQVHTNSGGCPQGLRSIREPYFAQALLGGKATVKSSLSCLLRTRDKFTTWQPNHPKK